MSGEAANADAIRREHEATDAALAFMDETAQSFGLKIYDPDDELPEWLRTLLYTAWNQGYGHGAADAELKPEQFATNPYGGDS